MEERSHYGKMFRRLLIFALLSRGYVYLGGYVLEKLQRSGGGTFIWGGYVYLALNNGKCLHFRNKPAVGFGRVWLGIGDPETAS